VTALIVVFIADVWYRSTNYPCS